MPTYCGAFVERAAIEEAVVAAPEAGTSWVDDLHCTLLHTVDGASLESLQAAVGKDCTVAADALCVVTRLRVPMFGLH